MTLQKHTIDEVPPANKELLMGIDVGAADGYNIWTIGTWNEKVGIVLLMKLNILSLNDMNYRRKRG